MNDWLLVVLVPLCSGAASYVAALAAVKTDIAWIKRVLEQYGGSISRLHERINRLVESQKLN